MSSVVIHEQSHEHSHDHQPVAKYVYNHDIMSCTSEGVVGNFLYSGRALGLSNPWDIIQLHPDLKPLWGDISSHYARIGLSHSHNVIWSLDYSHWSSLAEFEPSVYIFSRNEYRSRGDFAWYQTATFINSKNHFMDLAAELDVDVPKTLCFESVLLIDDDAIAEMEYPCYLKAAISISGLGVYRCDDKMELMSRIGKFEINVPVQIQEEVKTDLFLNLQYQVVNNQLIRLAASEQILHGYMHQGNRVPARFEPWESVDRMAMWLKDQGMKGVFAFDIAVINSKQGLRFPAIECNPRFNGATYPTMVAQKLGISEWSAVIYTVEHRSLKDVDLRGIEFDKKTGEGVIIVNWGTVLVGKMVFLLAGSQNSQDAFKVELARRLC